MQWFFILALASTALAMPAADPRPAPTPMAAPNPAPIAGPEPTAAPEPQFGFGLTPPSGGFNVGANPFGAPAPKGWAGRPQPAPCNGIIAAQCIYSSVSGSIYSSVSNSIQDGILDAIGLKPKPTPTPVPYYPGGGLGWNPPPYPQQGAAPYPPQQAAPYPYQQDATYPPPQAAPYPPQQQAPYPPQQVAPYPGAPGSPQQGEIGGIGGWSELPYQSSGSFGGQQGGFGQQNAGGW